MRITRLRLHDVKRHADLDLEFAPGLTVIRGDNEAGKSTVQRAIEMVLFKRPTSTAQELDGVRPWGAPDAEPRIEMDFDDEGTTGSLSKTFAGARGTASLELDGETITDPAKVEQMMVELTGLPSEKFFRSTAGVRHRELADLDRDEGALHDRLQLSMSGADRGTWTAKRRLEDTIKKCRAEGPKNPGPLKVVRDDIDRLRAELQHGETELARLEQDRAALTTSHEDRLALDAQLADQQAQLETAERAMTMLARKEDASVRYERNRRAAELRDEIARREAAHPSPTPLPALRAGVERVRTLEYDISEKGAELALEPDVSEYSADIPKPPLWWPFAVLAVVLGVGAVGAFVVLNGAAGIGVAAVLLIAALAVGFWARRQMVVAREVRLQNELREMEIERRLRGQSELKDQLRAAERERQSQLASLGLPDLASAEQLLTLEGAHVAGIDTLRAEFKGLVGEAGTDDDVAVLRDQAAAEAEQMRHGLAGMGSIGADPAGSRTRLQSEIRTTTAQRERQMEDEGVCRGRVDNNRADAEQVAAVAERLAAAQEHLAALDRRLRIYEGTLAAIQSAERTTMKKAARYLEEHMGHDIAELTDGRYRRVRVDEQDLTFSVYSPESGTWVDADELSQGTIDQLYLAARLGLVRQVTQERRPPLIFDDPFVTFDLDRARRAIALLKKLASDHQVIYLTCSDRYDKSADRVITLPAPEARDVELAEAGGETETTGTTGEETVDATSNRSRPVPGASARRAASQAEADKAKLATVSDPSAGSA